MNVTSADPHWYWWIIWYFYLGGIAAGAFFLATLAEFFGSEQHRRHARIGYLIAAPLIAVCGILLIADLTQPTRFWHMLLDHDSWLPHVKVWSPMSIGAWAVLLFSLVSTVSWFGVVAEAGWLGLGRFRGFAQRLHRGFFGKTLDLVGVLCGFFVASYTGVLLTATNQPVWSQSPWIGTLFLASSAGTGVAAIVLLSKWSKPQGLPNGSKHIPSPPDSGQVSEPLGPFHAMEPWVWTLELVAAACLLFSLGTPTLQALAGDFVAWAFLGGALGLGILIPAVLRWQETRWSHALTIAAVSVLIGGFFLRYSVLSAPHAIRSQAASVLENHPASRGESIGL